MEGNISPKPGDYFNVGFNFQTQTSTSEAMNVTIGGSATVPVICSDNSLSSFVVPIPVNTYVIPAGNTASSTTWPPGDEGTAALYQGTVIVTDVCHGLGANGMQVNGGPTINLVASRSPPDGESLKWQFHYRDANAKGGTKGNVNCANASAPYQSDAATCQASWSSSPNSVPCPSASQCGMLTTQAVSPAASASPAASPSASPAASASPLASPIASPKASPPASPAASPMCSAVTAAYTSQFQSTNACGCGAFFTASVAAAYNCSLISPGCGSYFCSTPMSAAAIATIAQCQLA